MLRVDVSGLSISPEFLAVPLILRRHVGERIIDIHLWQEPRVTRPDHEIQISSYGKGTNFRTPDLLIRVSDGHKHLDFAVDCKFRDLSVASGSKKYESELKNLESNYLTELQPMHAG